MTSQYRHFRRVGFGQRRALSMVCSYALLGGYYWKRVRRDPELAARVERDLR